jgi:hypothetical protein
VSSSRELTSDTGGGSATVSPPVGATTSGTLTRDPVTSTAATSQAGTPGPLSEDTGSGSDTTNPAWDSTNTGSSNVTASETTAADSSDGSRGSSDSASQGDDSDSTSASETNPITSDTMTSSNSSASPGCKFAGNVSYNFNNPDSFPSDALEKLKAALDEAIQYYNCYSDLSHSLTINYKPSVTTAEGNVDGVISFGTDRNYMVVATVMHEIAHTMGVGYAPWTELIENQRWVGPAVVEYMTNLPSNERDSDEFSQRTYITCDSQHFWPYGLNQAAEHQTEWSLINHVRVVAAMNKDKAAFRRGDL